MDLTTILAAAEESFKQFSTYLNPVIVVFVIVLGGIVIGGVLNSALRRAFAELRLDERASSLFGVRRNYARATRHTIVRSIYLLTVIFALHYIGILLYAFYVVAGLLLLLLLIKCIEFTILFFPNLSARSKVLSRVSINENVTVFTSFGAITGTVERLGIIYIRIRRENGDTFLIPHSTFEKSRVVRRKNVQHNA